MNQNSDEKMFYLGFGKLQLTQHTALEMNLQLDVLLNLYFLYIVWIDFFFVMNPFVQLPIFLIICSAKILLQNLYTEINIMYYGYARIIIYLSIQLRLIYFVISPTGGIRDWKQTITYLVFIAIYGYTLSLGTIVSIFLFVIKKSSLIMSF